MDTYSNTNAATEAVSQSISKETATQNKKQPHNKPADFKPTLKNFCDDFQTTGSLSVLLALLEHGQVFAIEPKGYSMFPFFSGYRDVLYVSKPSLPLRRGDIALYRRDDGMYVVHRVHHIKETPSGREYYMLGDNQTWIEGPLSEDHIHGVVKYYDRKVKKIDCTSNRKYNLLWRMWMFVRPLRPVFYKAWRVWHTITKPAK